MVRLSTRCGVGVACGLAAALAACYQPAQVTARAGDAITITLKKDFIEKHRNRVTIDVQLKVDAVGKVHAASKDGEMHFAGRADEVGLPIVAELMNAKDQPTAVKAIRMAKGKAAVQVKGAWRLWCEHADGSNQKQGMKLAPFPDSNPPHVFEIHPITQFGDDDVLDSVGPIPGFRYKEADRAFTHYENVACNIRENKDDTVTIRTNMAGFNITEFIMESADDDIGGKVFENGEDDGRFLFAAVHDTDGELLVRKVRLAFIKGTDAEIRARTLAKGGRMRVVGIPRISMTLIDFRIKHQKDDRDPLNWTLPYEVIIVGVID